MNYPQPTAAHPSYPTGPKRLIYPFKTPEQEAEIRKARAEGRPTGSLWDKWATAYHDMPGKGGPPLGRRPTPAATARYRGIHSGWIGDDEESVFESEEGYWTQNRGGYEYALD